MSERFAEREIMTASGQAFDFWKPTPDMICIEDIAHSLACTNRYSGHTRVPYSVAEHCVRMSYMTVGDPLLNLLHDAAEAYIGDIPRPHKQYLEWRAPSRERGLSARPYTIEFFKDTEDRIFQVIMKALNLEDLPTPERLADTKTADNTIMVTEVRDLMPAGALDKFGIWTTGYTPLSQVIEPWGWEKAKHEFLSRYYELKGLWDANY